MDKRILAISWQNGKFIALNFVKGEVKSVWICPEPVNDESNFKTVLAEAVNQTGYEGEKVLILIGTRKLSHHIIEVPPVRGADLEYYIERKANQLKTFEQPLAYSFWKTLPTRTSEAVLVNIYPRPFLENLVITCRELGFHLSRMFSLHATMRLQLPTLQITSEEAVALVVEMEGTTALLIGRKDGQIYFARTIYSTWRTNLEYLGTEIMRSILFVKQQFGAVATRIFIYGDQADQWTKPLSDICGLPVEVRKYPATIEDWLKESLKLPEETTENLVTPDWRKEPQTRLFIKMVGFVSAIIIAGIMVWIGFVEKEIRHRIKVLASLQPLQTQLQESQKEILSRKTELEHRKELIRIVTDNPMHPVPGWFFGYLSDVLPEDLVLKEVQIYWTNGVWKVRISGVVQPVGNKPIEVALANGLQMLQNRLEKSPFHFKVTGKTQIASAKPASNEPSKPTEVSDTSKEISPAIGIRRQTGIGMIGDELTNNVKTTPEIPPFLEKVKPQEKSIFWIEGVMK